MANALFNKGREGFLAAEIDWNTAVIGVYLVRGYTFDATDQFVSEITAAGGTLVSGPITIATPTVTDGIADGADIAFTAVAAGAACDMLIICQRSAVTGGADVAAAAQRLIACIDTATGLPVTPNGGDINVAWDAGANKIFKL